MCDERRDSHASTENHTEHLETVPDGAGCAEIWDRLSESREGVDE